MEVHYFIDQDLSGISQEMMNSLLDLVRRVWDQNATKDQYLQKRRKDFIENPYAAEGGMPIALLVENDHVVGHVASVPCKIWSHGREALMYWNAGLHLLKECRGKGLGNILPQKMIDTLPVVTGFFVIEQQLKTHRKMGWTIVGRIPEYIKVLNPANLFMNIDLSDVNQMPGWMKKITSKDNRMIRLPGAFILASCYRIYEAIWKLCNIFCHEGSGRIMEIDAFDDRVNILWNKVKHQILCAQVRHSAYMNWKFKVEDGWIKVVYEEEGDIIGYAILSQRTFQKGEPLSGLTIVSIIDMLWDFQRPDVMRALLSRIEIFARNKNADALMISINFKRTLLPLIQKGFVKIPSTVYFAFFCSEHELGLSSHMEDWFITRGDADAAGSLGPRKI